MFHGDSHRKVDKTIDAVDPRAAHHPPPTTRREIEQHYRLGQNICRVMFKLEKYVEIRIILISIGTDPLMNYFITGLN